MENTRTEDTLTILGKMEIAVEKTVDSLGRVMEMQ